MTRRRLALHPAKLGCRLQGKKAGHAADHHHLAMGKVNHEKDAVDQGIAQGHQCIDAAQYQAIDQLGYPK
jgi:hypothetical protein